MRYFIIHSVFIFLTVLFPINDFTLSFRYIFYFLIWIVNIWCILVNLRRFIEFHRVYLNIFYGIELQSLFFRAYFILKNIHIFWKYRLVSLFISIPIKLVGLLNLCFYNTLLSTGRVDTDIFTFLLVISIFLKSIIIPDFFQRSINILGLHKVYVGQTQSYLFFWFLRIVYWFTLFLNF